MEEKARLRWKKAKTLSQPLCAWVSRLDSGAFMRAKILVLKSLTWEDRRNSVTMIGPKVLRIRQTGLQAGEAYATSLIYKGIF
jgi:hypothetical protein